MAKLICINPFWVSVIGVIAFIAWINLFRVAQSTFPKIKERETHLYEMIISRDGKGWIERGWYSPIDIDVQFRLYRAIYRGDANQILSHRTWRGFVWSARIFVIAPIMGFICVLLLFFCYTNINKVLN